MNTLKRSAPYLICAVCAVLLGLVQVSGFPAAVTPMVIFAPFFAVLISRKSFGRYFRSAGLFCLIYYFIQNSFLLTFYPNIPVATPLAVLAVIAATVIMTLWAAVLMLAPLSFGYFFKNTYLKAVSVAMLFVLGEHIQELSPPFAFPWSRVECTLTSHPVLLLPSRYLGASFCALTAVLLPAALLAAAFLKRKTSKAPALVLAAAAVFGLNACWGLLIKNGEVSADKGKTIDCMIVQSSVEGGTKDYLTSEDIAFRLEELISENIRPGTELILVPETAVPTDYSEESLMFRRFSQLAEKSGAVLILGCFTENGQGGSCNSLMAFEPDGSISGSYSKNVLVPFGEYAPIFKDIFGSGEISPAPEDSPSLIECSLGKLGALICIESIYSDIPRRQAAQGAQLILIPTNDSWFGSSFGRSMHFRHSVIRAVESGKYVVRSGNCGISAFISPTGQVLSAEYSKKEAVLFGEVSLDGSPAPYATLGDLIIIPAGAFLLMGIILAAKKLVSAKIFRKFSFLRPKLP